MSGRFTIRVTHIVACLVTLPILLQGCGTDRNSSTTNTGGEPPCADREFRAVWVATVNNIDWPDKPGLTSAEQQREARIILDSAAALGLNAVVLQVRPQCDAIYPSAIEPWSCFLTGEEGKAPDSLYDPLAFWIEEAHNRGLELHAWFNPYRAHLAHCGAMTDSCVVRKHPGFVRRLPDSTYWLDPGDPAVQEYSWRVVMDVVRRYDIDGVQFDDYFYPYGDGSFPDDTTWQIYRNAGGARTRNDWRRENINSLVRHVYAGIKAEKRHVKFGLSPFGIWRPGFPRSIAGFDQYNNLYADARLWLNEGWVDYWSPQLYWPTTQIPQSYPVLLGWWEKENTHHRHLWPGLFTSRLASAGGLQELTSEIMVERGFVPEAPGHIHFSMRAFLRDSSLLMSGLRHGPYRRQALVPPSPWLGDNAPETPHIAVQPDSATVSVSWSVPDSAEIFRWVVYVHYGTSWDYLIFNRHDGGTTLQRERIVESHVRRQDTLDVTQTPVEHLRAIEVSAIDRLGNESAHVSWSLTPQP